MDSAHLNIGDLSSSLDSHRARLAEARRAIGDRIRWYPYDILGNLTHVDQLLHGDAPQLVKRLLSVGASG